MGYCETIFGYSAGDQKFTIEDCLRCVFRKLTLKANYHEYLTKDYSNCNLDEVPDFERLFAELPSDLLSSDRSEYNIAFTINNYIVEINLNISVLALFEYELYEDIEMTADSTHLSFDEMFEERLFKVLDAAFYFYPENSFWSGLAIYNTNHNYKPVAIDLDTVLQVQMKYQEWSRAGRIRDDLQLVMEELY